MKNSKMVVYLTPNIAIILLNIIRQLQFKDKNYIATFLKL